MSISEDILQAVFINSVPNFFVWVSITIKNFFVNLFGCFIVRKYKKIKLFKLVMLKKDLSREKQFGSGLEDKKMVEKD
jgi:hypothetical protein